MEQAMNLVNSPKVRVDVRGRDNTSSIPRIYTSRKAVPHRQDGVYVLTQEDFQQEHCKYIIQYTCVLLEDVTIPKGCLIEFDGGSIVNGEGLDRKLTGTDTLLISLLPFSTVLQVEQRGTFSYLGWMEDAPADDTGETEQ